MLFPKLSLFFGEQWCFTFFSNRVPVGLFTLLELLLSVKYLICLYVAKGAAHLFTEWLIDEMNTLFLSPSCLEFLIYCYSLTFTAVVTEMATNMINFSNERCLLFYSTREADVHDSTQERESHPFYIIQESLLPIPRSLRIFLFQFLSWTVCTVQCLYHQISHPNIIPNK